jgi:hypothetical protein
MRLINLACAMSMTMLASCTYSINVLHTEGSASDMIDEQQTPTATTTATVPLACLECEGGECECKECPA